MNSAASNPNDYHEREAPGLDATGDAINPPDNVENRADPAGSERAAIRRSIGTAALGEVCSLLLALPRYQKMYLQDLDWMALVPLSHGRFTVVRIASKDGTEQQSIGGVIWATVSAEVDQHIRQQIKTSNFPIRLRPTDWTSGDITWLLDVLAPNRALTTKIFAEVRRTGLGGARKINAHPIVQSLIDAKLLQKMGADVAKVSERAV